MRRMLTGSFSYFSICLNMTIPEMSRVPIITERGAKHRSAVTLKHRYVAMLRARWGSMMITIENSR